MLTKQTIEDLVTARLPESVAYEHLKYLEPDLVTPELLTQFVSAIIETADGLEHFQSSRQGEGLMDCCGTGGSGKQRFNTSTSVAFVLASGDVEIAKFGNRSSSVVPGCFDFLDQLGINQPKNKIALLDILAETNLVFLFAPDFYPAYGKLKTVREALGTKTILNFIGPLLNPVRPHIRLLGTPHQHMQDLIAQHLSKHAKIHRAAIVSSESGLDELDPHTENKVIDIKKDEISSRTIAGKPTHIPEYPKSAADSAQAFLQMMRNFDSAHRYYREIVILNAGIGFEIAGKVKNIEDGKELAETLFRTGEVKRKFEVVQKSYAKHA